MNEPKLRIGYNCINMSIGRTYSSFRLQTIRSHDIDKIRSVVDYNLMTLGDTIYWNLNNNFRLFRLSSQLVPFISHDEMQPLIANTDILNRECVREEFRRIRNMVKKSKSRITIHPSQMNVLSSSDPDVIKRTIKEITMQAHILSLCGGDTLLLHVGGVYGDKDKAKKTFIHNVRNYVPDHVMKVLAIENDDKSYTSEDVIEVTSELGLPWVHDFHHEILNPSYPVPEHYLYDNTIESKQKRIIETKQKHDEYIINLIKEHPPTKYHMCSGMNFQPVIEHDPYVEVDYFKRFINQLTVAGVEQADIMFESKTKNLSVMDIMAPLADGYWRLK